MSSRPPIRRLAAVVAVASALAVTTACSSDTDSATDDPTSPTTSGSPAPPSDPDATADLTRALEMLSAEPFHLTGELGAALHFEWDIDPTTAVLTGELTIDAGQLDTGLSGDMVTSVIVSDEDVWIRTTGDDPALRGTADTWLHGSTLDAQYAAFADITRLGEIAADDFGTTTGVTPAADGGYTLSHGGTFATTFVFGLSDAVADSTGECVVLLDADGRPASMTTTGGPAENSAALEFSDYGVDVTANEPDGTIVES